MPYFRSFFKISKYSLSIIELLPLHSKKSILKLFVKNSSLNIWKSHILGNSDLRIMIDTSNEIRNNVLLTGKVSIEYLKYENWRNPKKE